MIPIDIPDGNIMLQEPRDLPGPQYLTPVVFEGTDTDGLHYFLLAFRPSREDIEAIRSGGVIYVKMICRHSPPVTIFTVNEENKINYEK